MRSQIKRNAKQIMALAVAAIMAAGVVGDGGYAIRRTAIHATATDSDKNESAIEEQEQDIADLEKKQKELDRG